MRIEDRPSSVSEESAQCALNFVDVMPHSLKGQHGSSLTPNDTSRATSAVNDKDTQDGFLLCSSIDAEAPKNAEIVCPGEPKSGVARQRMRDMINILIDKNGDHSEFWNLMDAHIQELGIDGMRYFAREANRQMVGDDNFHVRVTDEPIDKDELADYKVLNLTPPIDRAILQIEDSKTRAWRGCPNQEYVLFNRPVKDIDFKMLPPPEDTTQWMGQMSE